MGVFCQLLTVSGLGFSFLKEYGPTQYDALFSFACNTTVTNCTLTKSGLNLGPFTPIPVIIILCALLLPIFTSLFTGSNSCVSFTKILRALPSYFFFLPTLVGLFGVFSICNFGDFTWGNRDSSGSEANLGARLRKVQARGKIVGVFFYFMNMVSAIALTVVLRYPYSLMTITIMMFGFPLFSIGLSTFYWIVVSSFKKCFEARQARLVAEHHMRKAAKTKKDLNPEDSNKPLQDLSLREVI